MASKLTEITTKYHTFVDNQVLTKDQLNEFVNYFDDQDRLSRVFLSGVGVVCGFKISKTSERIILTPGVGVTTDGDLIQLKQAKENLPGLELSQLAISFTHYKKFDDDSANYQRFRRTVGPADNLTTELLDLYELFPDSGENLSTLNQLANWENMAVLLYLESFAKKGDLCTAIDCDNQGTEELNRLRVLLVSKSDAEFIAGNDSIFSANNTIDDYFALPKVAVKRVILDQISTSKYEELKRAYYDAINADSLVSNLCSGISQIVNDFDSLLQLNISGALLKSNISKLKGLLSFSAYQVPFNIQYRYDFLKDVVDTYNEITALLLSLKEICSPDITAFPKHIMLGLLSETNTEPKQLRHSFYKSPAVGYASDKIKNVKSLVTRLFELIKGFGTKSGSILITPSNKLPELSKRSIPFYYTIGANLLKSWDFCKTSRFAENTNLSYNRAKLANLPHIKEPLFYNTDKFDFYRIEGHQGKDYRDVLEELADQKKKYNLSFDVKALSVNINAENLDIDDFQCEFEDLKVMLKAWTAEQDCILAQVAGFFSGFSTKVPGANVKEAELDLKRNVGANFASINISPSIGNTRVKTASTSTVLSKFYQPVVKENVVSDNLITTEDTLGIEMKKAFDANKGGSVNDIIATVNNNLKDKVDTEEWNADPTTKEFVVNKSVELMAHTHVLTQRMPNSISVVDTGKINEYKLSLTQLCSLVQKLKAGYQSTQLSVGLRAFVGLLINQLSTVCCSGKKLEILLEEVNQRKEQILLQLQLSKFLEKHTGMEHRAGVEPGGTFILVYKNKEVLSDSKSITEKLTSSSLVSKDDLTSAKLNISSKLLNIDQLSGNEKTELLRNTTNLLKYTDYIGTLGKIESLERIIPISNIPDNTVIADFALPYLCCSDCASINYIISKPPASLRLEKDKYCLLTDTEDILFEVSPAGGIVETDPAVAGISIEGNKLVIVPDSFPADMLGKPIRFTVNSQVTDADLTVYQGIKTDFNVPEEPTSEATHTFVPRGELKGAKFMWEFGDGEISEERNPSHTYKLPVNEDNKVTVTLTVTASNGICKTVVEHDIIFTEIKPGISLTPDVFCENDKSEYPFTITPPNSRAKIEGEGVVVKDIGGYFFIPAAAKVGTISFLLNGEPSGVSVTVNAAPKASISARQEGNQLIIDNKSKNATKFNWLINGSPQVTETQKSLIINLSPNDPNEWKIKMEASGADSCPPSTTSLTFVTKFIEEPPVNNCIEEAKAAMLADLKLLRGIKPVDTGIVEPIWRQTLILYGGTPEFTKGILNRVDDYMSGKLNDSLPKLFVELLTQTANMIAEMRGQTEFVKQLTLLFEIQLRLFYNIVGCQTNEVLRKNAEFINTVLTQIVQLLTMLQEFKIIFSDTTKAFIQAYAKKVEKLVLLNDHIKEIISKSLI